jgi:hypothetical protein
MAELAEFAGWFRVKRGQWREVCRDADEGRCWQRLLDLGRNGERVVLRAGQHPDDPPPAARQPRPLKKF